MTTVSIRMIARHPVAGRMRNVGDTLEVDMKTAKLLQSMKKAERAQTYERADMAAESPSTQPASPPSAPKKKRKRTYQTRVLTAEAK